MEEWSENSAGYSSSKWKQIGNLYESKEEHHRAERKWGSGQGKDGRKNWTSEWEISPENHYELTTYYNEVDRWGTRFRKRGQVSVREEWIRNYQLPDESYSLSREEYLMDLRSIYQQAKETIRVSNQVLVKLVQNSPMFRSELRRI